MERILSVLADETMEKNGMTVEKILRQEFGLSKKQIRRLKFQQHGIEKNHVRCRVVDLVAAGDVISVLLENGQTDSSHIEKMEGELQVLYEDQDLLVVNKPAGLVTHPKGSHYQDTLVNLVKAYFQEKGEQNCIRPLGRLDKDTSGIVLFGKNRVAAARLQKQREQGTLKKTYLAVVHGNIAETGKKSTIYSSIDTDPENPLRMRISENGKSAVTHYMVRKNTDNYTIVKLWLETGRTHQIRVHMASLGHPLIGDPLYAKEKIKDIERTLLHAWKLEFVHPMNGEILQIEAEIPQDMKSFCD